MNFRRSLSIIGFSLFAFLCVAFAQSGNAQTSVWKYDNYWFVGGACSVTITRGEGNAITFKVSNSRTTFKGIWPDAPGEVGDAVKNPAYDGKSQGGSTLGPDIEVVLLRFDLRDGRIVPINFFHRNLAYMHAFRAVDPGSTCGPLEEVK